MACSLRLRPLRLPARLAPALLLEAPARLRGGVLGVKRADGLLWRLRRFECSTSGQHRISGTATKIRERTAVNRCT